MAQPIRDYTPHRNEQDEFSAKVENAPVQHARAVLAAYDLLQEAQDHGVLDTLRGAIGAGDAIVDKVSEFASHARGHPRHAQFSCLVTRLREPRSGKGRRRRQRHH